VLNICLTDEQENDMSDSIYTYIKSNVEPFLSDPPDTDFQRGYLSALLQVAEDGLGLHLGKSPFSDAQKLVSPRGKMHWLRREITQRKRDVESGGFPRSPWALARR
jgi:hypothetical protein